MKMKNEPANVGDAVERLIENAQSFIVATAPLNGAPELLYQGNRQQLTVLFRLIRDELRSRENIGNHPHRRDIRAMRGE